MGKTVRIVLYVLSALTVVGVLAAFILAGKNQKTQEIMQNTAQISTEENIYAQGEPGNDRSEENHALDNGADESELPEAGKAQVNEGKDSLDKENYDEKSTQQFENGRIPGEDKSGADAVKIQHSETTILFTGDVLFGNAFQTGYDANGIEGVLSEELLQELKNADILMINNEFPFSDRGTPMPDKQYTFRCSPSYATALTEMGVDVASLANNHTLDYGKDALLDTFLTLENAGIRYAGAGETVERAEEVQIIEVNGKKFGFLAVSRVIPTVDWKIEFSTPGLFSCYDDTRLIELVREAKQVCDYVAVYPHWGVEHAAYPEDYQKNIARRCIEAGADVIVGAHTHCLQGAAYINGKPIFYSLGNFMFGQSIEQSAVLKVIIDEKGVPSYQYLPVYAAGGVTDLAKDTKGEKICSYLNEISDNAGISATGMVTEITKE